MKAVLLDTHVWVWSFLRSVLLSPTARLAIERSNDAFVSAVTIYEVTQKVRLGKWPEAVPIVDGLDDIIAEQHLNHLSLTPEICRLAGSMDWPHRDPFDRMLAATALVNAVPIVSADPVFDGVVTRIW